MFVYYVWCVRFMLANFIDYDFIFTKEINVNRGMNFNPDVHVLMSDFMNLNVCVYAGMAIIVWFSTKKDRTELIVHHVGTVFLIMLAKHAMWLDISIWVLFVNAVCDVELCIMRICYKAKSLLEVPTFIVFTGLHIYLRVVLYTQMIVTTAYRVWDTLDETEHVIFSLTFIFMFLNVFWMAKLLYIPYQRYVLGEIVIDDNETEAVCT